MMIFFLLFAVLVALALQKVSGAKNLEAVAADHHPSQRIVEPGEVFRVDVTLENKSRRFLPFLRVRERFERGVVPQEGAGAVMKEHRGGIYVEFTTWLRPRQRLVRSIPITVTDRGRYVLGEFRLFVGDFLGLRDKEKECGRFKEVVAPPKETDSPQLNTVLGGFMGELSVNRFILEDPVLTLGYREYTGREPMKMISWAQSARGGGLMVKKNDYTVEPSVSVLLNVETEADLRNPGETLEFCFSLARTVCAALERQGVNYSFASNAVLAGLSGTAAADKGLGHRHFQGVLEHLGRATYDARVPMTRFLEQETGRFAATGRILITPSDAPAAHRTVERLREMSGGRLLVLTGTEVAKW